MSLGSNDGRHQVDAWGKIRLRTPKYELDYSRPATLLLHRDRFAVYSTSAQTLRVGSTPVAAGLSNQMFNDAAVCRALPAATS